MVTRIGLTGGIGSGKTTVAKLLLCLGYPVYFADREAKVLMSSDPQIITAVTNLFGSKAYLNGTLNRELIAQKVFDDKVLLTQLNEIVHPVVANHFNAWCEAHANHRCVFQEAAILFENGGYKRFDQMILVTAPKEVRLRRVVKRDKLSDDAVLARMNNQWDDDRKGKLSDYIVQCDGNHLLIPQVLDVLKQI